MTKKGISRLQVSHYRNSPSDKNMKTTISTLILICFLSSCSPKKADEQSQSNSSQVVAPRDNDTRIIGEQTEADTLKGSLKAKAMGTIGNTGITVNYYSP